MEVALRRTGSEAAEAGAPGDRGGWVTRGEGSLDRQGLVVEVMFADVPLRATGSHWGVTEGVAQLHCSFRSPHPIAWPLWRGYGTQGEVSL